MIAPYRFSLFIFVALFVLKTIQSSGQNLVVNSGFEEYNKNAFRKTCKFLFSDTINVKGWSSCGNDATESWHQCSSSSMYVSNKDLGIKPHSGKWMVGFNVMTYPIGNNQLEYIIGRTLKPLQSGSAYMLTFYLSPRDGCEYGIEELGIAFSNNIVPSTNYNTDFSITPHITFPIADITQKGKWYKITLNFVATGGETNFVLGNFNPDFTSKTVVLSEDSKHADHWNEYARSFYFIDDVEIVEIQNKRDATLQLRD